MPKGVPQGSPQGAPGTPRDTLKAPRDPKGAPGEPPGGPRDPPSASKEPQAHPTSGPGAPWTADEKNTSAEREETFRKKLNPKSGGGWVVRGGRYSVSLAHPSSIPLWRRMAVRTLP